MAVDAGDRIDALITGDLRGQGKARRGRQGQAGQVVKVTQAVAAQGHGGVELAEIERMQDAALGGDARVAGADPHVERIGDGAADIEQRAAGGAHLENLAVEAAVADERESLLAGAGSFVGIDRALERQVAFEAGQGDAAVGDDEILDERQFGRLARIGAVAEIPVGAAGPVLEQEQGGALDFQARQDDTPGEERHQFGRDGQAVNIGDVGFGRAVLDHLRRRADLQSAHRR